MPTAAEDWRDHELIPATANNDVSRIKELLEFGCDPSWPNEASQTPLHIAALWAHVESTKVLLSAKADVNAVNQIGGSTPIHVLLRKEEDSENRVAIAKLLVDAGADTGISNDDGHSAGELTDDADLRTALGLRPFLLQDAVRHSGPEKVAEILDGISKGEIPENSLDALNNWPGYSALHLACFAPSTACTELLVKARASLTLQTQSTWQMPLHLAAWSGSFFVVELLVQAKADVNAIEPDQDHDWDFSSKSFEQDPEQHFTALHISSQAGNIPMMKLLLDAGAEVDATDSFGRTPLHLCVDSAKDDEFAAGVGVRVNGLKNKPERNGKLGAIIGPLELEGACTGCEDPDCGRYPVLVEEGPPEGILLKPVNLSTVFQDAIDLLISYHANVNLGNRKAGTNFSLLHSAARAGDIELAQKVLAARAQVNLQAAAGLSPLHLAIRGRKLELITLLLEAQADPNLQTGGKTAYELAAVNGLDLDLVEKKAKLKQPRTCGSEYGKATEFEKAALYLE